MTRRLAWLIGLLALAVACSPPPRVPPLMVFAASSLAVPLDELAGLHELRGGQAVRVHLGASGTLARQILEGAPADVFISADEQVMAQMVAASRVDPASQVVVASNRLALVVLRDRAGALPSLDAVLGTTGARIGVGDPDVVPLGYYTREWLTTQGQWAALLAARRLVLAPSAQAVLAHVQAGATDAAVIFRSDVRPASPFVTVYDVPSGATSPIHYIGVIVATTAQRQAAQIFLDVLEGPEGQTVLADAGFERAATQRR